MFERIPETFGQGHFVATALNDPTFYDLPARDQARILGWADSCPVVEELTDPANHRPGRGPEAMVDRYGEVNAWFTFIGQAVEEAKPELYAQLVSSVSRREDEPVGKYEPESVPSLHETEISPMGTLPGFALPRLMIKQIGKGSIKENQDRLLAGLEALDVAIKYAATPAELLAYFAGQLYYRGDVDAGTILSNTLPEGWMGEHNAHSMLNEVRGAIAKNVPDLWFAYASASEATKSDLKIA